jgi:hypothetical protein
MSLIETDPGVAPMAAVENFPKPPGWRALPMYRKIALYGETLGEVHAAFADKLRAKRHVLALAAAAPPGSALAAVTTARILRELASWEDLRAGDLASGRMVKATHGCKWQMLGAGAAAGEARLEEARARLRRWSESSWTSATSAQRHYALIPPRFFVEEVLPDALAPEGEALCYMVRCLRGAPICLSVLHRRAQNSYYPGSGKRIVRQIADPAVDPPPPLRRALLAAAAALAAPFEFVRVDFHVPHPRADNPVLYFSEFTFTPAAGAKVFPDREERRQGAVWWE